MRILDVNTGESKEVIFDSLTMVGTGLEVSIAEEQLDGQLHVEEDYEALTLVDTTLHEVAEGTMYTYTLMTNDGAPIGDNQDLELLVTTPVDKHVHATITSAAGGNFEFKITEDVTIIDEGSGMQAYNINRNYPDTGTTVSGYSQPTTVGGVTIYEEFVPGGTKQTSVGATIHPDFILDNDEDYVIKLTNRAGDNQPMTITFEYYSHDE